MNVVQGRACFLAVTLAVWALGAPKGLAQDRELDIPSVDQSKSAEPGAATSADVPSEPTRASRQIEEIVVTAERKEERLHDVPVSMSVLDDGFLRQQGVSDLADVARYVPNVRFTEAGSLIQPRIRGFSTLTVVNRGLELPVGIVVDEVPYSRAEYFVSGLFDLDRVEVLRGPQGQLFGANTTVGLVNLITKNPSDEFTGFIDSQLGQLDSRRFEGAVGGPLLRGFVNFRLSGLWDGRDGYVRNTTAQVVPEADKVFGGRLRQSARLKLDFPNLFGGSLLVSYQRDFLDFTATPRELTFVPQKYRALLRQYDPNFDSGRPSGEVWPINLVGSLDSPSFNRANLNTFTARGRYDLGAWGLNVVAGWADLASRTLDDADSTPADGEQAFVKEVSRHMTFELRVTSPDLAGFLGVGKLLGLPLGSTSFTTGFFFQRRTQSPTDLRINMDAPIFLLGEALNMAPDLPLPTVTKPPQELEFLTNHFEQTTNEFAGFGQMDWRFADRWTLLYGMRLDYITKDASTIQNVTGIVFPQVLQSFANDQNDRELHFSPKLGMKYDWTESFNLYWNWSTNFQAGGFNNFGSSADPATRSVKPAYVRDWEAGTKMRLFDGAAELNLGLFWMTMTDFQLFTVKPPPNSTLPVPVAGVTNVGKLRARGVEADSAWFPTEWLTLRGALGFNDTEYLDFPLGDCLQDMHPPCDLAGRPLEQAPHWDISLTPIVRVPLASIPGFGAIVPSFLSKTDLTQALNVQYTDNQYLHDSDDPRTRQPSFFHLDGNIGFANASQGWSLQFRVQNLTDVRTANTAYEALPFGGTVFKAPEPPRVMSGALRWEF